MSLDGLTSVLILFVGLAEFRGQSNQGSIAGNIADSTGAAVPHAQVVARNKETGVLSTAESSATGSYRFPAVPLGSYDVSVTVPGFKAANYSGVLVQVTPFRHWISRLRSEVRLNRLRSKRRLPRFNQNLQSWEGLSRRSRRLSCPLPWAVWVPCVLPRLSSSFNQARSGQERKTQIMEFARSRLEAHRTRAWQFLSTDWISFGQRMLPSLMRSLPRLRQSRNSN